MELAAGILVRPGFTEIALDRPADCRLAADLDAGERDATRWSSRKSGGGSGMGGSGIRLIGIRTGSVASW